MKNHAIRWTGQFMLAALLLSPRPVAAKVVDLLPRPQQITTDNSGTPFALGRAVSLADPTENSALQRFLEETSCTISDDASAKITVELVTNIDGAYDYELAGYPDEAYTLHISENEVRITAVTTTGVTRAAQTLCQLAEGWDGTPALEALTMTDWPAFKLRGFMHDVGRSYISFEELKHEIDLLSRFKVNTFHWHLTENQAWRFESKKYPQLTEASAMTRFAGQYYTQAQCTELEQYAAERGMIVIPEIDMPGHSEAFERAMGHSMQTQQGVEELQQILEEVAEAFPLAPYIHIGADEKTITYTNFLETMTEKLHGLGKKVVCWNPISGVTIDKDHGFDMTQMWSTAGNKIEGLPNIDCRYNYINHFDVFADVVGIYKSNVYYQDKGSADVAGLISAPWNDRKTPTEEDIIQQNNLYAACLASAERGWAGGGKQYIEVGGTTLPNSGEEYEEFADWERRFLFHKDHSLANEPIPYVKQTQVRWRITDAFPNGGNADLKLPPETEGLKTSYEYEGKTYRTGMATGAGIYLRHTWGTTVPAYFSSAQTNTTAYAWTYVYSETERTVGALIEFQNYSRSENDQAPDEGKWDRKGSRIYVNDEEILPPVWENTGISINSEVDLKNENFTARQPTEITLKEGWNKVLLKLPYNPTSGVRLSKWMFTFVLTDKEGRNALEDVIYSPNQYKDASADQVAAAVAEAEKQIAELTGTEPGYYSEELADGLKAAIEEIEPTLTQELTAEERSEQAATLEKELEAFEAALEAAQPNQPKASTLAGGDTYAYHISSPLRDTRYMTSRGAEADVIGDASPSNASQWMFVMRDDQAWDIVNVADGTYLSPNSSYNTALKTQTASPSAGWTLKRADTMPYMIVTSGTVQVNQTNSSLGYKLYNWGDGSNTSDAGCQLLIATAEIPDPVDIPEPVLTLVDMEFDGQTPLRVDDTYAADLLAAPALTTVIDYDSEISHSPSALVTATNTQATDSYLAYVMLTDNGGAYGIRYSDSGGQYTQRATVAGRHQMVIVADKSSTGYSYYLDGAFGRSVSIPNDYIAFCTVDGADAIYLGGFVTADNDNRYPFTGTLKSVRFYTSALTAEQVAALNYDDLVPTGISSAEAEGTQPVVNGKIVAKGPYRLYTPDGRQMLDGKPAAPGVYILHTGGKSYKVTLK